MYVISNLKNIKYKIRNDTHSKVAPETELPALTRMLPSMRSSLLALRLEVRPKKINAWMMTGTYEPNSVVFLAQGC